jgi:hypothetical protein
MNQRKRRLETGGVFVCTEDGVSAANGVVVSEEQFCCWWSVDWFLRQSNTSGKQECHSVPAGKMLWSNFAVGGALSVDREVHATADREVTGSCGVGYVGSICTNLLDLEDLPA